MRKLARAVFIGPSAFDTLRPGATGSVHSVFERTFNISVGGKLVGVARADVAKTPINLITDIAPDTPMSSLVRKNAKISITNDALQVGGELTILLEGVKLWRPRKKVANVLETKFIEDNLRVARESASSCQEGLGQLLPHIDGIVSGKAPSDPELNPIAKSVLPNLTSLVDAVKSGDLDRLEQTSGNLLGLGPGLSPSADDMLVGFMAGLRWTINSLGKNIDRVDAINQAIMQGIEKTTLLSQQLLIHAARGEVNEMVQSLLEAILAGGPGDVRSVIEKVLKMGETSGVDTTVGILLGIRLGLSAFD